MPRLAQRLPTALLAFASRQPSQAVGEETPPVSVIISTLDRAGYLETTLDALRLLRYPRFEVIVVEGPSTDATASILDRWETRIKRIACPAPNLSMSRNLGLAAAAGTLVAFIDDDSIPEPDWLGRLVAPFADPSVGATGGAIRNFTGVRYQCRALTIDIGADVRATTIDALTGGGLCPALTGTNFCVRRDLALAAGMFDEAYVYFLEESDLQRLLFEAGYRLVYDDHAEVHHQRAANVHRDGGRIPTDYIEKMSSVAYYCLKHRRDGDARGDVASRIARHLLSVVADLSRFERRGRLTAAESLRRLLSARRGLRKGIDLFKQRCTGRSPAKATCRPAPPFQPFATFTKPALRVAMICRGSHQSEARDAARSLAKGLAARSIEITLVEGGETDQAAFRDGYWTHSVARRMWGVRRGGHLRIRDALRELRRVEINRHFDVVIDLQCRRASIDVRLHPWRFRRETIAILGEHRWAIGRQPSTSIARDSLIDYAGTLAAACMSMRLKLHRPVLRNAH